MTVPEIWTLLGQFGPLGLMIGYLVWSDTRKDDQRLKTEEARRQIDKERTESDRALAMALSALTVTIQHLEQRVGK